VRSHAVLAFAGFTIVRLLTGGGPQDLTHIFAIYAFRVVSIWRMPRWNESGGGSGANSSPVPW